MKEWADEVGWSVVQSINYHSTPQQTSSADPSEPEKLSRPTFKRELSGEEFKAATDRIAVAIIGATRRHKPGCPTPSAAQTGQPRPRLPRPSTLPPSPHNPLLYAALCCRVTGKSVGRRR